MLCAKGPIGSHHKLLGFAARRSFFFGLGSATLASRCPLVFPEIGSYLRSFRLPSRPLHYGRARMVLWRLSGRLWRYNGDTMSYPHHGLLNRKGSVPCSFVITNWRSGRYAALQRDTVVLYCSTRKTEKDHSLVSHEIPEGVSVFHCPM